MPAAQQWLYLCLIQSILFVWRNSNSGVYAAAVMLHAVYKNNRAYCEITVVPYHKYLAKHKVNIYIVYMISLSALNLHTNNL